MSIKFSIFLLAAQLFYMFAAELEVESTTDSEYTTISGESYNDTISRGSFVGATYEKSNQTGIDKEALSTLLLRKSFYLRFRLVNFFQAVQLCIDEGKRIASVDNFYQHGDMVALLRNNRDVFYIAGSDLGREGSWFWIHKHVRIAYQSWASGQPDNGGGNENCLEINRYGSATWNDVNCDALNNYVCENQPALIL